MRYIKQPGVNALIVFVLVVPSIVVSSAGGKGDVNGYGKSYGM